jgi:outer membrane protein assembly factor BamB
VHKDKIFIGSCDRFFYCIDANDGNWLWKYFCEGRVKTSAVIWKDFIFVGSDDRFLYCFTDKDIPKSSSGDNTH